ncbi:MAG TPA: NADPH-dependent F420 reductase [Mycobacteriales bacterium]|nr:NADPH-dependent F420 reductase [Mycobacteriales bacterium]
MTSPGVADRRPVQARLAGATIGILGGTGPQGHGLGRRFAAAGHPVLLGSRVATRAEQVAEPLAAEGLTITGVDNAAAAAADLVIVAVPYEGHESLLRTHAAVLAGKIVIDCVNPLGFDKQGAYPLVVPAGSAAQEAAAVLPQSSVVAAFHHVSAVLLTDASVAEVATDVLVVGDDRDAVDLVQALADEIPGMRGIYAGRLRNAHQLEALTANLISVNRRYSAHAGLRVTDI